MSKLFSGLLIAISPLFSRLSYSQDTIYSYPYPKGIVTKNINKTVTGYKFYPVDNPKLELILRKKEIDRICYYHGEVFLNDSYREQNYTVLPADLLTGKICFTDIITNPKKGKEQLYIDIKKASSPQIEQTLISEDSKNFSFQKYSAAIDLRFAGDLYHLRFNLLIEFKEGKLRYTYNDFIVIRNIKKSVSNIAKTITFEDNKEFYLEQMYSKDIRTDDQRGFWRPILEKISDHIKNLNQVCGVDDSLNSTW